MPNIEIKSICKSLDEAHRIADSLGALAQDSLHQVDTYYATQKGRLKLREINEVEAVLIPYYKDYSLGPMKSTYALLPVNDLKTTKEVLEHTLGVVTVVDKMREVYLLGNIRIHLDRVKNLGEFLEFEAVYEDDEGQKEQEVQKVHKLMKAFKIQEEDLLDKSYIDYLLEKKEA